MAEAKSETQTFFEKFRLLEDQRLDFDRVQLLTALGTALERAGHVRLVRAIAEPPSSYLSGLFVPVLFWGLGASIGVALGVSLLIWIALSLGIAVGYGVLAAVASRAAPPVAVVLILAWVGAAAALGVGSPGNLVATHAIPIGAALATALALRNLRLREARDVAAALAGVASAAPYVAPVVLVVILLPALTADVWRLAADTDPINFIGAASLSVGVLVLLVGRQLRHELEPALAARCTALTARATAAELTRSAVADSVDEDTARIIHELPTERVAEAWPVSSQEYAPYLVAAEGRALRRPLTARLLLTAVSIGLLLTGYIYALLAVTVPRGVAADWSDSRVGSWDLNLLLFDLTLPGDAYLAMAILLGIFATAIFLAFALTEERIASAMTEALLREPIDRFLLLALPFISLLEWGLENEERLQLAGDEASEEPEPSSDAGKGEVSR